MPIQVVRRSDGTLATPKAPKPKPVMNATPIEKPIVRFCDMAIIGPPKLEPLRSDDEYVSPHEKYPGRKGKQYAKHPHRLPVMNGAGH